MAKTELQDEVLPDADVKRLLKMIKEGKTFSCALAQNLDKKETALLTDRRQKGKKLAKKLRGMKIVNAQTIRFGYAEGDGGTLVLRTNKPMSPSMLMQLKPTGRKGGFSEIVNLVNEALEDESEEDAPEEADGVEAAAPTAAAEPVADAAPRPAPAAEPAPEPRAAAPEPEPAARATPEQPQPAAEGAKPDTEEARARLARLIKLVGPATLAYPSKKALLIGLANEAKTLVLAGDDASAKLSALEAALRDVAKARAEGSAPAAGGASDEAAIARLGRADQIWSSGRAQLRQDLDHLKQAVVDAYADNGAAQAAVRGSLGQLDAMFGWLDGRLEGAIGEALKAGSAEERRGLARQSADIAASYYKAAKAEGRIKDLDDNPFAVKTRFGETIDKLLPQLEKAMADIA